MGITVCINWCWRISVLDRWPDVGLHLNSETFSLYLSQIIFKNLKENYRLYPDSQSLQHLAQAQHLCCTQNFLLEEDRYLLNVPRVLREHTQKWRLLCKWGTTREKKHCPLSGLSRCPLASQYHDGLLFLLPLGVQAGLSHAPCSISCSTTPAGIVCLWPVPRENVLGLLSQREKPSTSIRPACPKTRRERGYKRVSWKTVLGTIQANVKAWNEVYAMLFSDCISVQPQLCCWGSRDTSE